MSRVDTEGDKDAAANSGTSVPVGAATKIINMELTEPF